MNTKKFILTAVACLSLGVTIAACSTDAQVASQNLSQSADNFNVPRRVVLYNGITDQYIQVVEGFCSLQPSELGSLSVICKTDKGFLKNIWRLSDNVTVFVEQLQDVQVSTSFYKVTFKPTSVIPIPELH